MKPLELNDVVQYVEENIGSFHKKRISSLDSLKLSRVLKRKNPYLFKAKNVLTAAEIVKGIVDDHVSSNEETIFGDWLEELAIFFNKKVGKPHPIIYFHCFPAEPVRMMKITVDEYCFTEV